MYAFFTMVMFGSIYYMLPRLLRKEWPSAFLINVHFWGTALGITIYVLALSVGGWVQGLQMLDAKGHPEFIQIMLATKPWLFARSMSGIMMAVGHIAFVVSFVWILVKRRDAVETSPTLFNTPPTLTLKTS
jgi:cytochrome c oxidase cbb3-type subunit 1